MRQPLSVVLSKSARHLSFFSLPRTSQVITRSCYYHEKHVKNCQRPLCASAAVSDQVPGSCQAGESRLYRCFYGDRPLQLWNSVLDPSPAESLQFNAVQSKDKLKPFKLLGCPRPVLSFSPSNSLLPTRELGHVLPEQCPVPPAPLHT